MPSASDKHTHGLNKNTTLLYFPTAVALCCCKLFDPIQPTKRTNKKRAQPARMQLKPNTITNSRTGQTLVHPTVAATPTPTAAASSIIASPAGFRQKTLYSLHNVHRVECIVHRSNRGRPPNIRSPVRSYLRHRHRPHPHHCRPFRRRPRRRCAHCRCCRPARSAATSCALSSTLAAAVVASSWRQCRPCGATCRSCALVSLAVCWSGGCAAGNDCAADNDCDGRCDGRMAASSTPTAAAAIDSSRCAAGRANCWS